MLIESSYDNHLPVTFQRGLIPPSQTIGFKVTQILNKYVFTNVILVCMEFHRVHNRLCTIACRRIAIHVATDRKSVIKVITCVRPCIVNERSVDVVKHELCHHQSDSQEQTERFEHSIDTKLFIPQDVYENNNKRN